VVSIIGVVIDIRLIVVEWSPDLILLSRQAVRRQILPSGGPFQTSSRFLRNWTLYLRMPIRNVNFLMSFGESGETPTRRRENLSSGHPHCLHARGLPDGAVDIHRSISTPSSRYLYTSHLHWHQIEDGTIHLRVREVRIWQNTSVREFTRWRTIDSLIF